MRRAICRPDDAGDDTCTLRARCFSGALIAAHCASRHQSFRREVRPSCATMGGIIGDEKNERNEIQNVDHHYGSSRRKTSPASRHLGAPKRAKETYLVGRTRRAELRTAPPCSWGLRRCRAFRGAREFRNECSKRIGVEMLASRLVSEW